MIARLLRFSLALVALLALAITMLWLRAFKPLDVESADVVCTDNVPAWTADLPLKILSYNVQYMASKEYVFFKDIDSQDDTRMQALQAQGKSLASRPSEAHIYKTLDDVADIILAENPDVVMLQDGFVRQGETWKVSDHLPVGGSFSLAHP